MLDKTLPDLAGGPASVQAAEASAAGPLVSVTLSVNGATRTLTVEPQATLVEVLRGPLDLTGTKIGCDRGACSACTVWVDRVPIVSCMMLAVDVGDRKVTTMEGLARNGDLHPVQSAFHRPRRCAMRILHARDGDELRRADRIQSSAVARRRQDGDRRPSLSVRHLSACVCRRARCGQEREDLTMAPSETRPQTHPFGITGVAMSGIERQVAVDEPPPLPVNSQLAVIGKPVPRINGRAKVTGAARFTVDVKLPGMLHARLLRSPYPHARIRSIDTADAERHPGVRAVHVITDVVGRAVEAGGAAPTRGSGRITLYVGDPIAAVAAATRTCRASRCRSDQGRLSGAAVRGRHRRRAQARCAAGVPGTGAERQLHRSGNGRGRAGRSSAMSVGRTSPARAAMSRRASPRPTWWSRGNSAPRCRPIAASNRTPWWRIGAPTASPSTCRRNIPPASARSWPRPSGLPLARVRVIVDAMGGGFGSKSSAGNYVRAAVELVAPGGRPGALGARSRTRSRSTAAIGRRPCSTSVSAPRRDGTLTAIALSAYGTAGVATGAGVGNIAQAMYECPNFDIAQSDVFINAGPGCPMRAPGNVPGAFALEQAIDELAEKLGLDPLALRDRIDPSPVRREERRIGAAQFGWHRRRAAGADSGPVKRGLGMAQSYWGANVQTNSACEVRILRDGSVEVLSSVQDIGTGIGTVLAQVVAEELGLRPDDITVRIGDTEFPAGPPSYGSMTTASITPPARNAAHQALQMLFSAVARFARHDAGSARRARRPHHRGWRGAQHRLSRGGRLDCAPSASARWRAARTITAGSAASSATWPSARNHLGGVQFAEVSVDTETGKVRVERVVAVQDCGRPMNPLQIESQVQGGILQGISYALLEERVLDRHTGHMLNADLEHYKIVGAGETPAIEVHPARELSGPELDRRLRHRRAVEHRDRAGHRQCHLQRDRRALAPAADDAGCGARRARTKCKEAGHDPIRMDNARRSVAEAAGSALRRRRRRHGRADRRARRAGRRRSSRRAASICST